LLKSKERVSKEKVKFNNLHIVSENDVNVMNSEELIAPSRTHRVSKQEPIEIIPKKIKKIPEGDINMMNSEESTAPLRIQTKGRKPLLRDISISDRNVRTVFDSSDLKKPKKIPKTKVDVSGVTLKDMVTQLEKFIGFDGLHAETGLRCFESNPTINSSLKALRSPSMEWARKKVEYMYIKRIANPSGN